MAKKTPVKKSRRRLKRSVRRSLAAVLMITAIGVAAIPVPENRAALPEGRAAVVDTHTVYSYNELKTGKWDESEEHTGGEAIDDSAVSGGFDTASNQKYLGEYEFEDPNILEGELIPKNPQPNLSTDQIISSLKIVDNGSEDELTWEYKYYKSNSQVILCDYNDRYPMGTVNLAPAPNIKYFKVTSAAFEKYFTEGGTSITNKDENGEYSLTLTMEVDPLNPVSYSYRDYKDMANYQLNDDYKFFSNYANEVFAQKTAEYKTYDEITLPEYQRAKQEWETENPGQDYPIPEPEVPNTLSTTMANAIGNDTASQIKFFCDYCTTLKRNGNGYTLKSVRDTTVTVTDNVAVFAYIAYGGDPTGTGVRNVDGYMVLEQGEIVSAIGAYAFKNVGNVDSIVLPTTVHYIADNAFNHCNSVVNITIDNVSTIGNNAFQNCNKLQSVTMGTGVNIIGAECFEGCSSLTSVTFSTNTTKIGDGAFANCDNVGFTTLDFNGIVEPCVIGKAAFYNCPYLSTVNMADSRVSKIGDSAFASVIGDSMTEFVFPATIEDSQDALGNRLFSGHSSLRRVVFSRNYGLTKSITIPESMFHGCPNLEYVMFPTKEGTDAYANANLKYTTGGTTTSNELFADVTNSNFYVIGPKEKTNGDTAGPRESTWKAVTRAHDEPGYVPYCYYEGGVEYYEICSDEYLLCIRKNGDGTGTLVRCTLRDPDKPPVGGKLIIPDMVGDTEVTAIDTGCFSDTNLTMSVGTVVINDHIKAIADSTFENTKIGSRKKWEKLTDVTIGSAMETIGTNAFYDCDRLVDITFKTPADNDYTKLKLGANALKTNGSRLTIHGDIHVGYSPFDYAVNPSTYVIDETDGVRVCYQSRWDSPESKHMTVMYGDSSYTSAEGQTGYVTLLDYPKYSELEDPNGSAGKELRAHNEEREQQFYERYASEAYDSRRADFALAWAKAQAGKDTKDEDGLYYNKTKVDEETGSIIDPLYGPWINEDFCNNWTKYLPEDYNEFAKTGNILDWLFEPIVAQAMSKESHPDPYFEQYTFDFMTNYKEHHGNETEIPKLSDGTLMDYMGWNDFEKGMIASVEDIVIPAGIESIDIVDFREKNTKNFAIYGNSTYTDKGTDTKDPDATIIPGLFSGLIKDYDENKEDEKAEGDEFEKNVRGNDRIKSVTMTSVVYLPDYAFDNCERLEKVTLGDAMESVGALPFRDCLSLVDLTGNEKYPAENGILYEKQPGEQESYKIIECLMARGSGSPLSDMSVNGTFDPRIAFVSVIAESAFENCDNISVVDLYSATSLTEIPDATFKDCDNLAMVTLPASVNDIQNDAFAGVCKNSPLTPRCQIYIYGKEVSISDDAFGKDGDYYPTLNHAKERIKIWAYEDTAAARYAQYYSKDGKGNEDMIFEAIPASESAFSVIFMDYDGTQIGDTQWVINDFAEVPDTTELEQSDHRPGYRFSGWLGTNGQFVDKKITDNCYFWAQYESDGTMVNGKYVVEFLDGVDGHQLTGLGASEEDGKYYVEAGKSFSEMGRNGWEAPARTEHPGYTFLEWSHNWTENTIINSNMTIVALYKVDTTSGGSTSTGSTSTPSTTSIPGTTSNTSGSSGSTSNRTSSSTSSSSTSTSSTTSGSDSTVGKYTVTVINGSGSGSYDVGSTVIIAASEPAAGSVFQKWTTESNGVALASVSLPATTFTMPANNVTVTAEFTEAAAAATPTSTTGGTSGTGDNSGNNNNNNNGSTRVDITKPGISNKDLATANVNGSTDNFVIKITETDEATRAVAEALTNRYGTLDNILYYAMDISLYDSTGTVKITDTSGLTVDITIPIPDALVAYGGNNMAGAVVNGNQLESLNENFTTINGVPCIRFTATHFSPYTIYVDTGNLTEGMLDTTPKTGDPIHPKWFLSIGLASLSIILFLKKDKKVKVKTA